MRRKPGRPSGFGPFPVVARLIAFLCVRLHWTGLFPQHRFRECGGFCCCTLCRRKNLETPELPHPGNWSCWWPADQLCSSWIDGRGTQADRPHTSLLSMMSPLLDPRCCAALAACIESFFFPLLCFSIDRSGGHYRSSVKGTLQMHHFPSPSHANCHLSIVYVLCMAADVNPPRKKKATDVSPIRGY